MVVVIVYKLCVWVEVRRERGGKGKDGGKEGRIFRDLAIEIFCFYE
jgi:hypothetical protein